MHPEISTGRDLKKSHCAAVLLAATSTLAEKEAVMAKVLHAFINICTFVSLSDNSVSLNSSIIGNYRTCC